MKHILYATADGSVSGTTIIYTKGFIFRLATVEHFECCCRVQHVFRKHPTATWITLKKMLTLRSYMYELISLNRFIKPTRLLFS